MESCLTAADVFPVLVWENILNHLPAKDLCEVSLVCHMLNEILNNNPYLLRDVRLSKWKIQTEGINAVFSTKFRNFRTKLPTDIPREHLQELFRHLQSRKKVINMIDMDHEDLVDVPADVLGEVFANTQILSLAFAQLTTDQLTAFFTEMSTKSPVVIEDLNLTGVDLTEVSPDILQAALITLRKINLVRSNLTTVQIQVFFTELSKKYSPVIEDITLSDNISEVSPDILANALVKIKKINLRDAKHTDMTTFFVNLDMISVVEDLDVSDNGLCDVPPDILAAGLATLRKINLHDAKLTTQQLTMLFTEITNKSHQVVEEINLSGADLSHVPSDALYALTKIKRLFINRKDLKEKQWIELFGQILASNPVVVEYMWLGYWDEPYPYKIQVARSDFVGQIKLAVTATFSNKYEEEGKRENQHVSDLLETVKLVVKEIKESY